MINTRAPDGANNVKKTALLIGEIWLPLGKSDQFNLSGVRLGKVMLDFQSIKNYNYMYPDGRAAEKRSRIFKSARKDFRF